MTTPENRFITIVSGLPRSGTSMMMRMLEAGGVPVLTDNIRQADDDNPEGYYEFELVKRLREDASWLADAYGKAVKVIYLLLYNLPRDYSYKVIFMRRKLEEVIASQTVMLQRRRQQGSSLDGRQLAQVFHHDIQKLDAWVKGQANFTLCHVDYNDVLYATQDTVSRIERFLGYQLDKKAMVQVIDPSLHRQRA